MVSILFLTVFTKVEPKRKHTSSYNKTALQRSRMIRMLTPDLKRPKDYDFNSWSAKHLKNQALFIKNFKYSGMSSSKRLGILVVDNNSINKLAIKATHYTSSTKIGKSEILSSDNSNCYGSVRKLKHAKVKPNNFMLGNQISSYNFNQKK